MCEWVRSVQPVCRECNIARLRPFLMNFPAVSCKPVMPQGLSTSDLCSFCQVGVFKEKLSEEKLLIVGILNLLQHRLISQHLQKSEPDTRKLHTPSRHVMHFITDKVERSQQMQVNPGLGNWTSLAREQELVTAWHKLEIGKLVRI